MTTLYGIPTCDTCRKALASLREQGDVTFRDIRKDPLSGPEIARFLTAFGDKLLNRASTTWRGLSEEERAQAPQTLLAAHPTLMKRPVIEGRGQLTLGWQETTRKLWL